FTEAVVGANQPPLETQTPTQRERPRFFGQKRVGPCLDEEAVGALGGDGPAEAAARLDQLDVEIEAPLTRQLNRAMGRRQRSDAAALLYRVPRARLQPWGACSRHDAALLYRVPRARFQPWVGCSRHDAAPCAPAFAEPARRASR